MAKKVKRELYLKQLRETIQDNLIKVITGMRQCGKTTILEVFFQELAKTVTDSSHCHILRLSTQADKKYKDKEELQKYIDQKMKGSGIHYFLIDEVQDCHDFESVLLSSKETYEDARFYITGSNSRLLSEEIVRKLGSNGYEIPLYPLSFSEYIDFIKEFRKETEEDIYTLFEEYLDDGGMPDIAKNKAVKTKAFKGIYETIILNDICARHSEIDKDILKNLIQYISRTYGMLFSIDSVVKAINQSRNKKVNKETVSKYLDYLKESFYLLEVSQTGAAKNVLNEAGCKKYYVIDHSLADYVSNDSFNHGDRLENIIYLQLLRLGITKTEIGRTKGDSKEIDFVFDADHIRRFVQITQEMDDPKTEQREFSSFKTITYKGKFKKYILIKDEYHGSLASKYPDVTIIRIADWLIKTSHDGIIF